MKFSYQSGQRPLDGFTLKRGIGRGGFGEVYFALSDGGKEVALKLVRGEGQIELRGVAQCLNLKHSNLVNLYDLRTDQKGDHWVVMEYVAGEPLNVVLARHPGGVPRELAREWFLGIARAVGYLHDHGIVHRDLKPGNVFLENGMVKVGDYGLSKAISTSQRTAQTQSIGTVHYMAPEISTGNYNKQIDIYAAGVILFEMLSGRPPFEGESSGEILMKHLTQPPDLSKLPPEYVPILSKALAKNPVQRYASMAEMARAVEGIGAEAGKAAPVVLEARPAPRPSDPSLNLSAPAVTPRGRVIELCGSMALTVLFAGLATTLWAAVVPGHKLTELSTVFYLVVLATWVVLIPAKFWPEKRGDSWTRRVVMMVLGGAIGVSAWWLDGWSPGPVTALEPEGAHGWLSFLPPAGANEAAYFSYFALAFFALRWWRMAGRRRTHRFSFAPILAAVFWGVVLLPLVRIDQSHTQGVLVLALTAAVVQLVSPWQEPPPPAAKRLRLRYA
jgi:hypothetical protein